MKIVNIRTRKIKHYLFVEIETDVGITGLGEAGNWGFIQSTELAILKFSEYLVGKNPFQIEDIFQNLYRAVYFRGSIIMSALSAIDIALWDIKGKALNVPVYELLGGRSRDKVRVYASPMKKSENIDELLSDYQALKQEGFTAAKIFSNGPIQSKDGKNEFFSGRIQYEEEKVQKVRKVVGDDFDLILEVHRGMNQAEAVAFGRAVEKYHPMILEDPVPPDNLFSMKSVARDIPIPIATGERFINLCEFEMLLRLDACRYVRPDICAVGGITASKKISSMAEAHNVLVVPHNPLGPVSSAACLQIAATIPNLGIFELPGFALNGNENAMVNEPLEVEEGFLVVPDRPGIGIELSENAEDLYPFKERGSINARRSYDGSVKDW